MYRHTCEPARTLRVASFENTNGVLVSLNVNLTWDNLAFGVMMTFNTGRGLVGISFIDTILTLHFY